MDVVPSAQEMRPDEAFSGVPATLHIRTRRIASRSDADARAPRQDLLTGCRGMTQKLANRWARQMRSSLGPHGAIDSCSW